MAKPAKRPLLFSTADLSSSLALRHISMGAEPFVGQWDSTCTATLLASMSLSRSLPRSDSFLMMGGGEHLLG